MCSAAPAPPRPLPGGTQLPPWGAPGGHSPARLPASGWGQAAARSSCQAPTQPAGSWTGVSHPLPASCSKWHAGLVLSPAAALQGHAAVLACGRPPPPPRAGSDSGSTWRLVGAVCDFSGLLLTGACFPYGGLNPGPRPSTIFPVLEFFCFLRQGLSKLPSCPGQAHMHPSCLSPPEGWGDDTSTPGPFVQLVTHHRQSGHKSQAGGLCPWYKEQR